MNAVEKTTRVCFTCGIEKPLIEFNSNHTCRDGVTRHCKECKKKEYQQKVYGGNRIAKCSHCGNEFDKRGGKKYCSNKCKESAKRKKDRELGKYPKPRTPEQNAAAAKYARLRRATEEGRAAMKQARQKWKKGNPDKVNASHRRTTQLRAEREGREYKPIAGQQERQELAHQRRKVRNARIAFRQFIEDSSDEEVKCWYAATVKPWLNPRLTASQQWSVRYQVDLEFNAREKARLYTKKMRRKHGIAITNDGTARSDMLINARSCLYCGAKFDDRCKPTLDHLIPLIKGGAHSVANLVICCRACNSRKGKRDFLEFVQTLPDPYQARSLRAWRKLRGAHPQQRVLIG